MIATIIIAAVIFAALGLACRNMYNNHKKGRCYGCSGCDKKSECGK